MKKASYRPSSIVQAIVDDLFSTDRALSRPNLATRSGRRAFFVGVGASGVGTSSKVPVGSGDLVSSDVVTVGVGSRVAVFVSLMKLVNLGETGFSDAAMTSSVHVSVA